MKAVLIFAVLMLASCGDKRDESEVEAALLEVRLAASSMVYERAEARSRAATAADGVEYGRALDRMAEAERKAAEQLATDEEIGIFRQLGETEGMKTRDHVEDALRRFR